MHKTSIKLHTFGTAISILKNLESQFPVFGQNRQIAIPASGGTPSADAPSASAPSASAPSAGTPSGGAPITSEDAAGLPCLPYPKYATPPSMSGWNVSPGTFT